MYEIVTETQRLSSSGGAVDIIAAAARVFLADGDVDANNGGDNEGVHNSRG